MIEFYAVLWSLLVFVLCSYLIKKCSYRCILISYLFIQLEDFAFALGVYLMVFNFWVTFVIINFMMRKMCTVVVLVYGFYALYFIIEEVHLSNKYTLCMCE